MTRKNSNACQYSDRHMLQVYAIHNVNIDVVTTERGTDLRRLPGEVAELARVVRYPQSDSG